MTYLPEGVCRVSVGPAAFLGASWVLLWVGGMVTAAHGTDGTCTCASPCLDMAQEFPHACWTQNRVARSHKSRGIASAAFAAAAATLSALVVAHLLSQCLRSILNKHSKRRFLAEGGDDSDECNPAEESGVQEGDSEYDAESGLLGRASDRAEGELRLRRRPQRMDEALLAPFGRPMLSPPTPRVRSQVLVGLQRNDIRALSKVLYLLRHRFSGRNLVPLFVSVVIALLGVVSAGCSLASGYSHVGEHVMGFGIAWASIAWVFLVRTIYVVVRYLLDPQGAFANEPHPRLIGHDGPRVPGVTDGRSEDLFADLRDFFPALRGFIRRAGLTRSQAKAAAAGISVLAFAYFIVLSASVGLMLRHPSSARKKFYAGALIAAAVFTLLVILCASVDYRPQMQGRNTRHGS